MKKPNELEFNSGIYMIYNHATGKVYIGSSKSISRRLSEHEYALSKGEHNRHLQHSWKKYGDENFEFFLVEEVKKTETLFVREQYYLDTFIPWRRDVGYNASKKAQVAGPICGEDNPTSKLTWKQVYEIREKYNASNISSRKLAKEFEIASSTCDRILKNVLWVDDDYVGIREIKTNQKVDAQLATKIRKCYNPNIYGCGSFVLAQKFNLGETTIRSIVRNKTHFDPLYIPPVKAPK